MIAGQVVYGSAGRPVAHARVVLHEVSMGGDGRPIDSTTTDGGGRYSLTLRQPDSTALYVVSSWRSGVVYFSEPILPGGRGGRGGREQMRPLYVYDTSSAGPAVTLERRVVTVARPKRDGSRDVLELWELENPGVATHVAPDTGRPSWAGAIPGTAIQFQVGQGDVSAQAVERRHDSVAVYAPLPPRQRKQLSLTYVLPATVDRVRLPIDQPTAEVDLLLEDTAAVVTAARLDSLGVETIGGRRFARYRTPPLEPGASLALAFSARRPGPEAFVPFVIAFAALALAAGFVVALRRGR